MNEIISIPITDVWRRYPRPSESASIAAAVADIRAEMPDAVIRFMCADGTIYAGDVPALAGTG